MKGWTPDTILELIENYRMRPVLWDHSHPNAKKNESKHEAWTEIAGIMNRTDVEKKMNILIVQFRREIKKLRDLQEKHQNGEIHKQLRSKWFAFEAMYFLKDKMRKQKQLNLPPKFRDISFTPKRTKKARIPHEFLPPKPPSETDQIANIEAECDPLFPYETKDEYSAFGELVAIKIRKMPTASYKSRAMNVITNVLFHLESESMDLESEVHVSDPEDYINAVYVKDASANDIDEA